ncbi:LOW QUALITY PROTEIN: vitellogenin receptor [Nylanderia fulva]|uniref:LOW QUALITY PROTEIN: vitellogenin receptor n=1 Tax=Nylanderia fulva TaxID=613905 RepID=UPI0010FBAFF0|nr:LOW QUALITY PROTEIN: vitellogenin receptor [Nylanderia fulva]
MPRIVSLLLIYNFLYFCSYGNGFLFGKCQKPVWFRCDDGECVPFSFECDGSRDCNDGSDENNCQDFTLNYPHDIICATNEFRCQNKNCIPEGKFCDAVEDCTDGSDEYNGCVNELKCDDKFRCNDKHCVSKNWVCDGKNDCPDGSDEWNCDNTTLSTSDCKTAYNHFLCKNQKCISFDIVCNGKDDCGDGSDEGVGCKSSCNVTSMAKCSYGCKQTPSGPVCVCKPGYVINRNTNNYTCIDIDECQIYGKCDQGCVNTAGSYKCTCETGYILQDDKKTCKAEGGEATLVFSTKTEIRAVYLESKIYFTAAANLSQAIAVALDDDNLFCSAITEDNIQTIVKGIVGGKHEAIVTAGLHTLTGIAVDWITGNIYFTDEGNNHIGVCDNNGTSCTILISEQSKPSGIALLPTSGIMFWTDFNIPHIGMAGMDGKDRSQFITENIEWPTSITIDHPNNRLYWLDSKANIIESVRLDGTDRRIVLHDIIENPFSLAIFENKLYWSDWQDNTIQSCDKFSGKNWKIVSRADVTPYGIHIEHSALKPKIPNPCHPNPCSHLCILNRNKSYTCGCTVDKELKADSHTCRDAKKKQRFIIIAENLFIEYFHEFLGKPKPTASSTLRYITAATYDPITGTILANDKRTNHIIRYDPNNGVIKQLISFENKILGGMAFDYIGNNLYLSNKEDRTVEVHSLTTMSKTIFYFKDQPCDIALIPEEGIMFIIFQFGTFYRSYRLEKMKMNGIGPGSLIKNIMGPIVALHYDRDKKTLFSIDQNSGYLTSYKAEDQYLLRTGLENPVSLTTAGDNIFWTQRNSNLLYWTDYSNNVHMNYEQVAVRLPVNVETPIVIALQNIVTHEERGCQKNNGNCSDVCLPSSAISFICACPPGKMLSANNRTCTSQSACLTDEIKCSEHNVCIKRKQWCDDVIDCPNGEDEMNDCDESGTCGLGKFMCKDGTCINSDDRCNLNYECPDKSDEEDCPTQLCRSDEFQCRDGTCISNSLECDGYSDCLDFSDEINNHCRDRERTCPPTKFMCNNTRNCIPKEWECDGERDCDDGSDEIRVECHNVNICGDGRFKCQNGRCISSSLKCNGINDCGDETDEKYCLNEKSVKNCTKDKYLCFNTDICLPKRVRCNGVQDCPKNDDEHHCAYCFKDEFACDNQRCIPQSWVCDKTDDCGDKSDEKDCSGNKLGNAIVNASNVCENFKCTSGTCLPFNKVCDGIRDCSDNSDENGECTSACAHNNICKGLCYKTPLGGVCGCQTGYRLAADMVSCNDINECEFDVCSQICRNNLGSFQCSCYDGYVIRNDRVSCKAIGPPMELITVADDDIRKISSNLLSIEAIHSLMGLSVTGFDVNALDNAIYWSNDELGTINKLHINTNELSIFKNVGNPGVLAVDSITNNIYFNDNDRPNMIKVCNSKQQNCAIIVKIEGVARVSSLKIDSKNRWLFWSQTTWQVHDKPFSEICRTDMMGAGMKIISFRHIGVVSGLAIDYIKSRLYWSDSFRKTIESSNLDGSQRSTLLNTDMHQPLSINIFENSLYWLMGSNGQLQKCKLYGNKSCEIMNIGPNNIHKHFSILHTSIHPLVENLCEKLNCNYMCVLKAKTATCICQDGKPITPNSTCTELRKNDEMKFISRRTNNIKIRSQSKIYSITIVTLLVIVSLLCIYYYYQKRKLKLKTSNNLNSIRFQNPSYDRRDEVAVTLSSIVPHVCPGQHEYINPIDDNLLKAAMESTAKKSEQSSCQLENEDEEKQQQACLISFTRSKQ